MVAEHVLLLCRDRAAEAENGVEIAYVIPDEGALLWMDTLAIPADAPHPENAHKFINFIMDAQITADITNYVWYANANTASLPMVDERVAYQEALLDFLDRADGVRTRRQVMQTGLRMGMPGS